MTLEDVVQRAMAAGVRYFELEDLAREGEEPSWHWELLSADPFVRHYLPNPAELWFEWHGFGLGGGRPLGFLPFELCVGSFVVATHKRVERAGFQGREADSIEQGLLFALRAYVCDFDAPSCRHEWCPDFDSCCFKDGEWE